MTSIWRNCLTVVWRRILTFCIKQIRIANVDDAHQTNIYDVFLTTLWCRIFIFFRWQRRPIYKVYMTNPDQCMEFICLLSHDLMTTNICVLSITKQTNVCRVYNQSWPIYDVSMTNPDQYMEPLWQTITNIWRVSDDRMMSTFDL